MSKDDLHLLLLGKMSPGPSSIADMTGEVEDRVEYPNQCSNPPVELTV
jgi:hypothetical protein